MKTLVKSFADLDRAKRWDIDFHLPATLIQRFNTDTVKRVDEVADVVRFTRDPGADPESTFKYIDIASVDVSSARITSPQTLLGSEAPSRARKIVRAFDIVVSTVRPTRGSVAVVPEELHDEIASTGFSIVRAHADTNPFYLNFALRLASTREQFRKWSTGSSYPAILDSDVAKTLIPVPDAEMQDRFAVTLLEATKRRDLAVSQANEEWRAREQALIRELSGSVEPEPEPESGDGVERTPVWSGVPTIAEIREALEGLNRVESDAIESEAVLV